MKILITGGAGFIGSNAAVYFLNKGHDVTVFDNFSRKGGRENVRWVKESASGRLQVIEGDVRDFQQLRKSLSGHAAILHLAGQVAVTTSVQHPREDFEGNLLGTFNILEAARLSGQKPIVLYSSTNKVYGGLEDLNIKEEKTRYVFADLPHGVSEEQPLDFHSPYGCSKGAGDQYVRDYARIYELPTIVFRQSCIYGPRQFGIEDQGWVAWFMIAESTGKKVQIYGNGKQVRDLLYIDDLLEAYDLAMQHISVTKGKIYNIGGGPTNTISIWTELKPLLEEVFGRELSASFAKWRPGDQPIFVSDIRKAKREFGWEPKVTVRSGVIALQTWIQDNIHLFS